MDWMREVVSPLVDTGTIEVCQRGQVVDMDESKGKIRLRRRRDDGNKSICSQC